MLDLLRSDNINIFWSRDTSMVKGILGYTKEIERRERGIGRLELLPEINLWPVGDRIGMGVAIGILEK